MRGYRPHRLLLFCLFCLVALLAGCAAPTPHQRPHAFFPVGKTQAQKTPGFLLGGKGTDLGTDVICRDDGGCYFFGQTKGSFSPSADMLALYTAPGGSTEWSRRYGGPFAEKMHAVANAPGGGFLLAGSTQSHLAAQDPGKESALPPRPLLIRIAPDGQPSWGAVITGGLARIMDAIATPAGDYVLAGYARHGKRLRAAVVKLDKNGRPIWSYSYRLNGQATTANAVARSEDGRLMMVGAVLTGEAHEPRAFALALGGDGNPRRAVTYAGERSLYFARKNGGSFLLGGQTRPRHGPLLAVQIDPAGHTQWAYEYQADPPVTPLSMTRTDKDGFLVTGSTRAGGHRGGVAALFGPAGKPVTDLYVGGNGVAEFLGASERAPGHYVLWGDTTRFGARKVDMMGVRWSPQKPLKNDFQRKAVKLHPHKAKVEQARLSLDYRRLNGSAIPSSPIQLHP